MYYYIMESSGKKVATWQEKVKDMLGDLGIAGETVAPSTARTIEELATLGITKGYTTLVAIGSEKVVNRVAASIINHKDRQNIVLGVIPDNFQSAIAQKIGVADLKEACQALKFRKLRTINAGFIEPNKYFLTQLVIEQPKPFDIYLTLDSIKAGLPCNKIVITPGIEVHISDWSTNNSPIAKKLMGLLIRQKEDNPDDIYSSFFHSQTIRIDTIDETMPAKTEGDVLAKTPLICHHHPQALKLIVKRDMIQPKNDQGK